MTAVSVMRAEPFPHALIRDRWAPDELAAVRDEFPDYNDPRWITYNDPEEIGKKAGPEPMWGPATRRFIAKLRSPEYTAELEAFTGIDHLIPDTLGGGMHMTGPGGRLAMHVDFNRHPTLPGLVRRLNLLVFLNDEWIQGWGGTLYLGADRQVAVQPVFNTTVLFETSATSWHGHPEPIVGDHYRRSIAVYFWAPERPTDRTGEVASTVWLRQ